MNRFGTILVVLVCASSQWVFAEEVGHPAESGAGFEQHHAHEHGVARLDLVLDGKTLEISINSPAMNIVGFEHVANSVPDKKTLDAAKQELEKPAELFGFSAAAGCVEKHVTVESALLGNSKDEAEAGHADFDLNYQFECSSPEKLSEINVRLFARFPATEQIRASVVSPAGQSSSLLTAQQSVLILK